MKFADLKKALRIEPPVKIHWPSWLSDGQHTDGVYVAARFAPGRTYRVSISGLKDAHGQLQAQPFSQSVPFDDVWPTAAIGVTGTCVEPSHRLAQ